MKILVTGCAGFIGYFVSLKLLQAGHRVVGIDNLNDYYDVGLKESRLAQLTVFADFQCIRADIADTDTVLGVFAREKFDRVVHLAAQAGVRYSLKNPLAYAHTNLIGFTNILEGARQNEVAHLVYASTSSVYGGNTKLPFAETDPVDHPVSFYAATKKANELMAHAYSHLYRLPTTGLRFFTVYGPWGRPDMSPMLFARAILDEKPIEIYNHGQMARDFTYIDDIVEGVVRILDQIATPDAQYDSAIPDAATSNAPYRIFNVGNHEAVGLMDYITALEIALGKTAQKVFRPMQPGDVASTYADTSLLSAATDFSPDTRLSVGLAHFARWYRTYHAGLVASD